MSSSTNQRCPRRSAAQWHKIVEAQQDSGLSAPEFCREKDIRYPSFMNWKKKLTQRAAIVDNKPPTFVELTPEPSDSSARSTVSGALPVTIELDLGAGIHLRVVRAG